MTKTKEPDKERPVWRRPLGLNVNVDVMATRTLTADNYSFFRSRGQVPDEKPADGTLEGGS